MSAKEELVEEEVSLRNGGWSGELRKVSLGKGVKIAVQEFSRGSGNMIYRESKECREVKQKGKR